MDTTMILIWIAGIVAFIVLEAVTYQLVSVWFALGAIFAVIAMAAGADFTVQMIIFIAVSGICLLCLRPVSKKLLKNESERTNADSLIGKEVIITKEINNLISAGEGKVNGMTWTLRSEDNSVIGEGETAVVTAIEGVKLIVKRKDV